jgi:putative oxidoreductase
MPASLNIGLLLLRVVAGLTIAAHGAQKLFGWFEGPGVAKFAAGFHGSGLKPGWLWTWLVITGELGGGLSLALGLLTPLGAAGMFGAMFMAIFRAHWKNGFFNSKRGLEFPLQLWAIATAIGIMGPGDYSLDHALGLALPEVPLFAILAAAALVVDLIGLALGRRTVPPMPTRPPTPATAS